MELNEIAFLFEELMITLNDRIQLLSNSKYAEADRPHSNLEMSVALINAMRITCRSRKRGSLFLEKCG